jgi:3-oxoacyl-[acyl-carrier protein] reductase
MLYPTVVEVARGGAPRRLRPRPSQRRVALVAGSAGGPGRAIARRLAHDGLAVAVNDGGDPALALEVAGAIREEGGVAEAFSADATDERQAADLVAAVAERLAPLTCWCSTWRARGPRPRSRWSRGRTTSRSSSAS